MQPVCIYVGGTWFYWNLLESQIHGVERSYRPLLKSGRRGSHAASAIAEHREYERDQLLQPLATVPRDCGS